MNHSHNHSHSHKNILVAFLLNLSFAVLELVGGLLTGSVAILSDAVHDAGDAAVIGVSWVLEKKSHHAAETNDPVKAEMYSLLGAAITTAVLVVGSVLVILAAVRRLLNPVAVNYAGMLGFAIFGVLVNGIAAFVTRRGDSLNQKAVNLHMLEDVLGWLAVLLGSIIMYFTDWTVIDPIMSILIAMYILIEALKNSREIYCEAREMRLIQEEGSHGKNDL